MTAGQEPVDPDVDLTVPAQRAAGAVDVPLLAAVAAGGVIGAEGRYALGLALPHGSGAWPLATFLINVSGSLLIGVLVVVVTEVRTAHRLVRPFLGTGVLGGWTTFSTAMVDIVALVRAGRPAVGGAYLLATAVTAVLAAALGVTLTRAAAGRRRR